MNQLTENQYTSLIDKIYESIINQPDNGLGEMGDCRTEAKRIVNEWAEDNNITIPD